MSHVINVLDYVGEKKSLVILVMIPSLVSIYLVTPLLPWRRLAWLKQCVLDWKPRRDRLQHLYLLFISTLLRRVPFPHQNLATNEIWVWISVQWALFFRLCLPPFSLTSNSIFLNVKKKKKNCFAQNQLQCSSGSRHQRNRSLDSVLQKIPESESDGPVSVATGDGLHHHPHHGSVDQAGLPHHGHPPLKPSLSLSLDPCSNLFRFKDTRR